MRRSLEDVLLALRQQLQAWAAGASPDVRVLVYPPEWEALLLSRLPQWVSAREAEGLDVEVIDLGQAFRQRILDRDLAEDLAGLERRSLRQALSDLGTIADAVVEGCITRPAPSARHTRLLTNSGSLAAFVSYSTITNAYYGAAKRPACPVVIAFPGEADERSLSLLGLRADSNYRVPRI